ncbi:MAG: sulfatase-like hydrolase/transferase [Planctomycetota bacterium]
MRRRASLLAALLAGAALAACTGGDAEPAAKNLVLITLDTTRRDALSCYGAPDGVTPRLDALADESLLFLEARTVTPLTLPSHTSMLTGLYPPRHTVRDNSLTPVPQAASTLAERAAERGIATGAVVAAKVLSRVYGLDQGFDFYDEPQRVGQRLTSRPAEEVSERAVEWLAERPAGERFFLWAHYFDPHKPLAPAPEFVEQAGGDPYLGAVAHMDAGVGTLLDALRARPDWEDTVVVVVADHGEGLGEHGEDTHSAFVYDSTIRVPLFLRLPHSERAGEHTPAQVSVADVFPTAVDLLGLGGPGDVDGLSLTRALPPERGVYFESYYGAIYHQWSPISGWADADGKYVHSSRPEFYVPAVDPGETANQIERHDVATYLDALEDLAERDALPAATETIDRGILADLEHLGYAGAGGAVDLPSPLDVPADRPNPHDCAEELQLIFRSWNLGARNRHAEAARALERVVAQNPRNHDAWARLGRLRMRLADFTGAAEALERFVAIGPPWPHVYMNLGRCYEGLERFEEAADWMEKGLALDPENAEGLEVIVSLLRRLGRGADAQTYFERWESLTR